MQPTNSPLRILYISQYFPPEIGAPAARVSELSQHWALAGHHVRVLTGFPNHPTGKVHLAYQKHFRWLTMTERMDGIDVIRTWLWPLPNRKSLERVLTYTSFWFSAVLRGLFLRRPEIVIATSPQLLVGVAGWMLARVKRVPIVLEVRDIWPDAILASGVSKPGSSLARTLSAISRFLYRQCDRIVVVSPAFVEELVNRCDVPRNKISLIVNGVETHTFAPGNADDVKHSLDLDGRFVVSYVGTIGLAHGVRTALDAAERLRENRSQIAFVIIGEGAERASLEQEAEDRGLDNVFFLGQKPRNEIPGILRASDACLVLLRKTDAFKQVIPTKMLEFMSCGIPVVVGVDGQAREIAEAAGGGIYVEPENVDELVQAIEKLEASPELRRSLGERGRRHMVENFSREATAHSYIKVLNEVVSRQRNAAPSA